MTYNYHQTSGAPNFSTPNLNIMTLYMDIRTKQDYFS